ncbi:MAG: class II fructose-bisphosphate aldolase, partial [Lactobacillus iners]|nr:class II fructose-bisphosphate aldolase [Lactobacillus iners]
QDGGELASVEDAKRFVAAGVDKLACGIGNIHGVYPADWKGLNFDRLKEIADAVDVPLVLHGGSGIPQDQIKKAISLGIAKININTEFQLAFQEATRKYIEAEKDLDKANKGYDPRKLLRAGTDAITESMKEMISWMGTRPIDGKDSVVKFDEASLNEE